MQSILRYCDNASMIAIALTCRRFHNTVIPPKCSMADLVQIERWPCYDRAATAEDHFKQAIDGADFFACYLCLRIRSALKFSNAMMKGKRGKKSLPAIQNSDCRLRRFCIDCGIKSNLYIAGTTFQYGGAWLGWNEEGGGYGLVCLQCRQFRHVSYTSTGEGVLTRKCSSCM